MTTPSKSYITLDYEDLNLLEKKCKDTLGRINDPKNREYILTQGIIDTIEWIRRHNIYIENDRETIQLQSNSNQNY